MTKQAELMMIFHLYVHPDYVAEVRKYSVDQGHVEDVVSQPGFLWGCQVDFHETDEQGWVHLASMYGIESKKALDDYMVSDKAREFAKNAEPNAHVVRTSVQVTTVTYRYPADIL